VTARKGLVLEVDRTTPPILFHHGEGLRLEKLPVGSRVVYPNEPLDPVRDPERAIAEALANPLGDRDPLAAYMQPGMKLTIAFDDLSLPLPPMAAPDIRGRIIEQVLDMAAAAGVDDVELLAEEGIRRGRVRLPMGHYRRPGRLCLCRRLRQPSGSEADSGRRLRGHILHGP